MKYKKALNTLKKLRKEIVSFQEKYSLKKTRKLLTDANNKLLLKYDLELPDKSKNIKKDTEALIRDSVFIIGKTEATIDKITDIMQEKINYQKEEMRRIGDSK